MDPNPSYLRFRRRDLLVCLSILLILGILIPPIILLTKKRRDETVCIENLHKIALAALEYVDANGTYPPGCLGPNPDRAASNCPNVGTLVFLLPYLGESELYNRLHLPRGDDKDLGQETQQPEAANTPWWKLKAPNGDFENLILAQAPIKLLRCPFDEDYNATKGTVVAVNVYGPNAPTDFLKPVPLSFKDEPRARTLGVTNYLAVAGCAGRGSAVPIVGPGTIGTPSWGDFEGVFYNRSSTPLGHVQDGLSFTLMFGEVVGSDEPPSVELAEAKDFAYSWFCGALPTYYGLPETPGTGSWMFDSRHDVVHFATADGTVLTKNWFGRVGNPRISQRRRGGTLNLGGGRASELFSEEWWLLQEGAGIRDGDHRLGPAR